MKRLGSSNSLVPLCLSGWLDDEDDDAVEGSSAVRGSGEKKRRLSTEQVRALEKNFEVENKLEPERKSRLAQELSLQPRQVAVWFQNRRARWKTKQLERDYGALKSRHDALRLDYAALLRDKDSLLAEVKDLKAKLTGSEKSFSSIKEEPVASDSETKAMEEEETETVVVPLIIDNKDGSSDSDSSAVLNEHETSPLASFNNTTTNSSFSSSLYYQQQLLKVEDDEFLAGDEPCSSFFHDDQPPTMSWYCGEGWD